MSGNIGHAAVYYLFQKQENIFKKYIYIYIYIKQHNTYPLYQPLQITLLHDLNGTIKFIPVKIKISKD